MAAVTRAKTTLMKAVGDGDPKLRLQLLNVWGRTNDTITNADMGYFDNLMASKAGEVRKAWDAFKAVYSSFDAARTEEIRLKTAFDFGGGGECEGSEGEDEA